jgi:hypothetical protein
MCCGRLEKFFCTLVISVPHFTTLQKIWPWMIDYKEEWFPCRTSKTNEKCLMLKYTSLIFGDILNIRYVSLSQGNS